MITQKAAVIGPLRLPSPGHDAPQGRLATGAAGHTAVQPADICMCCASCHILCGISNIYLYAGHASKPRGTGGNDGKTMRVVCDDVTIMMPALESSEI